jgi:hypothetical protein
MFHGCEIASASRVRRTTKSLELAQLTRDQVPTREMRLTTFPSEVGESLSVEALPSF